MERLLLMAILVGVSSHAIPQQGPSQRWQKISTTKFGDELFVDQKTQTREGDNLIVWALANFKVRQRLGNQGMYVSVVERRHYNCIDGSYFVSKMTFYTRPYVNGAVLSELNGKWSSGEQIPGSVGEWQANKICGGLATLGGPRKAQ